MKQEIKEALEKEGYFVQSFGNPKLSEAYTISKFRIKKINIEFYYPHIKIQAGEK